MAIIPPTTDAILSWAQRNDRNIHGCYPALADVTIDWKNLVRSVEQRDKNGPWNIKFHNPAQESDYMLYFNEEERIIEDLGFFKMHLTKESAARLLAAIKDWPRVQSSAYGAVDFVYDRSASAGGARRNNLANLAGGAEPRARRGARKYSPGKQSRG